jgi:dUTP pyrophosphatase
MVIKVHEITNGCRFSFYKKGEWIDLRAAETITLNAPQAGTQYEKDGKKYRDVSFEHTLIPLGISMALPKGFEALIAPRSGTYGNYYIIQPNSPGVVDHSYSGTNDEWKMSVIAFKDCTINKGDRICQFRIQPSQKAKWWQKLRWLFTSYIYFDWVDKLNDVDRGGFGTSGVR